MGHRLSRIYTRTGDDGTTGIGDGSRVRKDSARIEAIGSLDELNSTLGMVLAHTLPEEVRICLAEIQHDLFDLGGELAMPGYTAITGESTQQLEQRLDSFNAELPYLKEFILPGGTPAAAVCHYARTQCRRAERRVTTLQDEEQINPATLSYLNRLSDLLFVIARVLARAEDGQEVLWNRNR